MTRGLFFLGDRPECEFPSFVPVRLWASPPRRQRNPGRLSARRSTSDKTGEGTRRRIREYLIKRWGAACHICQADIDLELRWPDPQCFTRDHLRPRSLGGSDSVRNQRPAHKVCNERRGAKPLTREGSS